MSSYAQQLRDVSDISKDLSIGIVRSEFHDEMVDDLVSENVEFLAEHDFTHITEYRVPWALEIPSMVSRLLELGGHDIILCFWVVLRWATTHYDTVVEQSARALMDISTQSDTVIINGIVTCEDEDQVAERTLPVYAISWLNYVAELVEKELLEVED